MKIVQSGCSRISSIYLPRHFNLNFELHKNPKMCWKRKVAHESNLKGEWIEPCYSTVNQRLLLCGRYILFIFIVFQISATEYLFIHLYFILTKRQFFYFDLFSNLIKFTIHDEARTNEKLLDTCEMRFLHRTIFRNVLPRCFQPFIYRLGSKMWR